MATAVLIRDELSPGGFSREWTLDVDENSITVLELIRERVRREVEAFNAEPSELFQGLVRPSDAERAVNGFKMRTARSIDWQQQYEKAIQGFEGNQIVVLVDDYQVATLEERIELEDIAKVTFLRLMPLIGG